MSLWTPLADLLTAVVARGEGLMAIFDRPPERPERSVAFTIAMVCLGAKMAKVDGQVKPAEVAAFRRVFQIAPEDEAAAALVYNLARQDAGNRSALPLRHPPDDGGLERPVPAAATAGGS